VNFTQYPTTYYSYVEHSLTSISTYTNVFIQAH